MTLMAWGLAALVSLAPQTPPTQNLSTLRGTIVDAQTNAPVADVQVTLVEGSASVRTGPDGRFEFPGLAARTYTLTVSRIGYIFVRRRVEVPLNTTVELALPLAEGTGTYQETVTVAADTAQPPRPVGVSSQMTLGSAGLADLRGVAADDPLRAMQALPGVATGDDFQAQFSVRGSAFRHVGVVMDGVPADMLLHTVQGAGDTGSIAMINTDILTRASLSAGPHARPFGDWLGATLEFDVRDGSRDRAAFRGAVSGTSASAVVEGPIGFARRGSWLVSIRKSYLDWLIRKLEPDVDSTLGFSDAQAKAVYDLTPRQQLQFFLVAGDATYREEQTSIANGLQRAHSQSVLGSLAWRYAHPRAVATQRVSIASSRFHNRGMVAQPLADGDTTVAAWRGSVLVPLRTAWTLEGGASAETRSSSETLRRYASIHNIVTQRASRTTAADVTTTSGWAQVTRRADHGGVSGGVRATDRTMHARGAVLPWVLAERTIGSTTVRASAGASAQFVDPTLDVEATLPLEPERATSYDVGVEQPLGRGVRLHGTIFYRDEAHILRSISEPRLDPVTGALVPEGTFPVAAQSLDGTSRGFDLVVTRGGPGAFTGWVGYTWAHTRYRDRISGENFDGDFDQRHTLNIFAQQRLSYRWAINEKLRVGSNFPIVGYFSGTPTTLSLSALRNRVRLPVYARLDLRASRTFTFERRRLTLFAEVMNALGRRNLGQADGSVRLPGFQAVGYAERLLPRVPSVGILIEF